MPKFALNKKPGTPFMYYSVIVFLSIVGSIVFVPLIGLPFTFAALMIDLSILFDSSGFVGLLGRKAYSIPSVVLFVAHALIFAGGGYLDEGRRVLGSRLIIWSAIVATLSYIPGYLFLLGLLPMARLDTPDEYEWIQNIFATVPAVYAVANVIVCAKARSAGRPER